MAHVCSCGSHVNSSFNLSCMEYQLANTITPYLGLSNYADIWVHLDNNIVMLKLNVGMLLVTHSW